MELNFSKKKVVESKIESNKPKDARFDYEGLKYKKLIKESDYEVEVIDVYFSNETMNNKFVKYNIGDKYVGNEERFNILLKIKESEFNPSDLHNTYFIEEIKLIDDIDKVKINTTNNVENIKKAIKVQKDINLTRMSKFADYIFSFDENEELNITSSFEIFDFLLKKRDLLVKVKHDSYFKQNPDKVFFPLYCEGIYKSMLNKNEEIEKIDEPTNDEPNQVLQNVENISDAVNEVFGSDDESDFNISVFD